MKKSIITIALILSTNILALTGCAGSGITKQEVGAVAGGVGGGYAGHALTGGSTLGTIGGTLGGAYLGSQVAKGM